MPQHWSRCRHTTFGLLLALAIGCVAQWGYGQPPPALPPDIPVTPNPLMSSPPSEKSDGRPQRTDADNLTAIPDPVPPTLADRLHVPAPKVKLPPPTYPAPVNKEKEEAPPSRPTVADLLNTAPERPKVRPAALGRSYALLVGVREYDHDALTELQYTENDVEKLAELLDQPGSPFRGNVRVLTTSRGQRNAADQPTTANIRRELDRLTAERTRHETVLLALAGHGVQLLVADPDGREADRSHSFFCPADAQLTGVNYVTGRHPRLINLKDALTQLGDCGAGARLVLVDACRNELKVRSRALQVKKEMVPEGVAALFSCKSGEFAHESERLKHGLFFHFVLQGLRGGAKNGRGEVTWSGLAEYVTEKVAEDAEEVLGEKVKQTPQEIKNISGKSPLLLTLGRAVPDTESKPATGGGAGEGGRSIITSGSPQMLGD